MNKILIKNIIIFIFFTIYKSKKLECQEEFFLIIKKKWTRRDSKCFDLEENVNEEIFLQNDEHDDNIDLDGVD